jgi:phytoene dehydrogenase-like protein
MTSAPDAVVVGAGPNGLVAAIAERGWRVAVVEAQATPGGSVRSAELIEPGYTNDVCSAFSPLGVASPVLSAIYLGDDGLRWLHAPTVIAHPALTRAAPFCRATSTSRTKPRCGGCGRWRRVAESVRSLDTGSRRCARGAVHPVSPGPCDCTPARTISPRDYPEFVRFLLVPVRRLGRRALRRCRRTSPHRSERAACRSAARGNDERTNAQRAKQMAAHGGQVRVVGYEPSFSVLDVAGATMATLQRSEIGAMSLRREQLRLPPYRL